MSGKRITKCSKRNSDTNKGINYYSTKKINDDENSTLNKRMDLNAGFVLLMGIFLLASVSVVSLNAEVIKATALKTKQKDFKVERNIFSPIKPKTSISKKKLPPVKRTPVTSKNVTKRVVRERDVEAEVREKVSFEGYVIRNAKNLALLTINGEFFVVAPGDVIGDNIQIVSIKKKMVTVKSKDKEIQIILKGDDENE